MALGVREYFGSGAVMQLVMVDDEDGGAFVDGDDVMADMVCRALGRAHLQLLALAPLAAPRPARRRRAQHGRRDRRVRGAHDRSVRRFIRGTSIGGETNRRNDEEASVDDFTG